MEHQSNHPYPPKSSKPNGLAIASFMISFICLLCFCSFPVVVISAAISIVLAILSRQGKQIRGYALGGIIVSIIGVIASAIITIAAVSYSATPEYQDFIAEYKKYVEEYWK